MNELQMTLQTNSPLTFIQCSSPSRLQSFKDPFPCLQLSKDPPLQFTIIQKSPPPFKIAKQIRSNIYIHLFVHFRPEAKNINLFIFVNRKMKCLYAINNK